MAITEIYSDLDDRYGKDTKSKDIIKDANLEAVKNSLRNILQTRKMERRMLPEFGASLEQLLFEPIDTITATKIGNIILEEIQYWETRIIIKNVDVIADIDKLQYEINLEFSLKPFTTISRYNMVLQPA